MGIGLNKDVLKRIVEELGLQSAVEKLPTDIIPTIQPVLIANPERIINVVKYKTSTGTITTTPTDFDFYLTNASISNFSIDNTGAATDSITVTLGDGSNQIILGCTVGSPAAGVGTNSNSINLKNPIKLKRGTNITSNLNSDTGAFSICGYTVE